MGIGKKLALALLLSAGTARAEPVSMERFRAELMGVPLCGTPGSGPLAGKAVCVVHLPDQSVVVAGAGILVRGLWDSDGDQVCRRAADDPLERRRCITYETLEGGRYKNSDGVELCVGPCGG